MRHKPRRADIDRLVNRRLICFSYLQIGCIQAIGGMFVAMVVMNDYGFGYKALLRSNTDGNWDAARHDDSRWMYTVHPDAASPSTSLAFFGKSNSKFSGYFDAKGPGFLQQTKEQFDSLPTDGEQFVNMFKIIGAVSGVQPCRKYSCSVGRGTVTNDPACFGEASANLKYDGIGDKDGSTKTNKCFDLWSVSQQNEVLRRAQTAYFLSIVQMQWANGVICKTRSLSIFQHGMRNMAFNWGLIWETALALCIGYLPFIHSAFSTRSPRFQHLLSALPFVLFIFLYDEIRKALIRFAGKERTGHFSRLARFVRDYSYW
jgi:Cation transporting ATPase, C-terminus